MNTTSAHSLLIVEDNPHDLHALNRTLTNTFTDWPVYKASSLHHLETVLAQTYPTVCIVDYYLPDATGLQVLETLQAKAGNIPIIMVTGGIEATEAAKVLELGALSYVEKDQHGAYLTQVTQAVQDILAKPTAISLAAAEYQYLRFAAELSQHNRLNESLEKTARQLIETVCLHFSQHRGGVLYNPERQMLASYSVEDFVPAPEIEPYRLDICHGDLYLGELVLFKVAQTPQLSTDAKTALLRQFENLLYQAHRIDDLSKQASFDSLTGALNRHMLTVHGRQELERVKRTNNPLSVLMLDIDHFKMVNDMYGHQTGDYVLVTLVNILNMELRKIDLLMRYGGEEFLVLLPNTTAAQAAVVAERLRKRVAAHSFVAYSAEAFNITLSLGHVTTTHAAHTLSELISGADTALYSAKQKGRNLVIQGGVI